MLAFQKHLHREGQPPGLHPEAQIVAVLIDVKRPDGTAFGGTEVCNPLLRLLVQIPQEKIVAVEQEHPVRGHALHDLHFRLPNSLLRAQKFNVGGADVDDNGHVRSCDLGQVGNFAEMVHAHFQHRDLGILRHGKHRHGHSDVVIVVGRGLTGDESLFQHGSDHFLRGALAHGAGDRHHLCADAFQFFPGDSPQSNAGVVHIDRGVVPHLAAAQSRRSAPVHSLFDEVVAVPRALKRDKQLPRLHDPGVIGRA